MDRKYNLKLDLQFRCNNQKMRFDIHDNLTSDFFIRVTSGGRLVDLEKAIVILAVIKPNQTAQSQFLEVTEGKVYADLNPNMKDQVGIYKAKALLIHEDERVTTDIFQYEVTEDNILNQLENDMQPTAEFAMLQQMLSRLSTIEITEEDRVINEANRILAEEERKKTESNRVEAENIRSHEEADRAKYEATRQSNETSRIKKEDVRVQSENARINNENARINNEITRVQAEQERSNNYKFMTEDEQRRKEEANSHKTAELARVQAEKDRVSEEAKRRTVEEARVLAENARNSKENERTASEISRVQAENQRVLNENGRKENEINRTTSENARLLAEQQRVAEHKDREKFMESFESKLQQMEADYNEAVANMTNGNESATNSEIVLARKGKTSLREKIDEVDSQIKDKVNQVDLEVQKARIDLLTKIENGQTDGNTELLDIRVAIDGKTYDTAGSAVREQIKYLNNYSNNLKSLYELNEKINIFEQDKYLTGYYIENNSSLGGYSILNSSSGVGKIAVVKIKPDTIYSIVKNENTIIDGSKKMFVYATDSKLFHQGDVRRKIDGVHGRIYETKVTFTSTSTDNYLYIYFSDDVNSTEYIQVTEGETTDFISKDLQFNPSHKLNVYNKEEVKELLKSSNTFNNILNYYIPCDKMKDYTIVDNTYNELLDLTSFNSAFDSLVDEVYSSKITIGNEGSSNSYPINAYRFKPSSPIIANKVKGQVTPKLIITGCLHGSEKPSALALLNLCKNLKDKWQANEFLTYLRFNVELIVVPVLNPWGYVNNRRGNFNHVDLNRNFDYKWANQGSTDSSSDNYRGTSANSEKETQAIINLVNSEKEGLIGLIDIHALGSGDTSWELLYRQEISNSEYEDVFLQIASSNLSETTSKGIAECNIPIDINTQLGKIGIGYSSAAIDNYFNSQGIISSCCEVAYRYVGGINYHTDVNKLNTYFVATNIKNFINTFLYM